MKRELHNGLEFKKHEDDHLTLGVELEFQVLDKDSLLLTPRAVEIIDRCNNPQVIHEFFQSTLEIVTHVCRSTHEIDDELKRLMNIIRNGAAASSLTLSSTGTHPLADYRERLVTPSSRYDELIDRNQWLIRRMAVYGMHIHIGMPSGDSCIRYNNFFMHFLPHISALSASSPFWQGMDTGLRSCRPTTYEALPTAGMPYLVKDWKEFQKLFNFLLHSKAINSMKDVWWDLRPSPKFGTLELRFCDEPATREEAVAIVAFVHLLAHWFRDHEEKWTREHTPLKRWIFRENKWRTIRYGFDAEIVVSRQGQTQHLKKDIQEWMERLEPYVRELGYEKQVVLLQEILSKGSSAERQHDIFARTGDLMEVVRHNVAEFEKGSPVWN
ncbi:MAG: YbdK family carboxylate-amine ligase [Cyclobacteriaceae bacterium]|nr:YbdK family carboxylate-amine ligase [Cyclobacteriaceae bacterium]